MDEREELEALRREVTQLRAALVRLSGHVVDPPDSLRRVLGLEIPVAPVWVGDEVSLEWLAYLAHDVLVGVTQHGSPGVSRCCFGWRVVVIEGDHNSVLVRGEADELGEAKRAALKAAEGVGVALVAKARVGLKALEVDHG